MLNLPPYLPPHPPPPRKKKGRRKRKKKNRKMTLNSFFHINSSSKAIHVSKENHIKKQWFNYIKLKETFDFFKKRNLPFPVWGLWLQNHQHFHAIVGNSLQSENDILLTYIYFLHSAIRHEIGYIENKYGKNILNSDLFMKICQQA